MRPAGPRRRFYIRLIVSLSMYVMCLYRGIENGRLICESTHASEFAGKAVVNLVS
jgi:hypothetical protein